MSNTIIVDIDFKCKCADPIVGVDDKCAVCGRKYYP
jgi:hypothetical protein